MGYLIRTMTADVAEAREILKFALEVQDGMGLSKRPTEDRYGNAFGNAQWYASFG